jgi:type II secretory pathway pseudopilin PulG
MKTNTLNQKRKAGMTLLELTVVILVLLSLISILFVGARAWKKGSDRAGCIMNIRNVQQAVRGYANMRPEATSVPLATILGADGYLKTPSCPAGGSYTEHFVTAFPATGALAYTCSKSAAPDEHVPGSYSDW